ncbi:hypothetical protein GCM10010341_92300 [Streptomyces noursei]|nr:hypothetical protein GCM10010341_92300 [Streptomyces noursei]
MRRRLIGVSTYQDPEFPSVPAAGNSLQGVHRMLVDEELGGWLDDQVFALPDPVDCRRVMSDLCRHSGHVVCPARENRANHVNEMRCAGSQLTIESLRLVP